MSFSMYKVWDNSGKCDAAACLEDRTWTRRIQWIQEGLRIKLKLTDQEQHRELNCGKINSYRVWEAFKTGASISTCIAVSLTPPRRKSDKISETTKKGKK